MCNLAGFSGKKADPNILKLLLILGDTRGKDSTGGVFNNKVIKSSNYQEKTPREYLGKVKFGGEQLQRVILHSRKSSVGGTSLDNAHPVVIDDEGNNKKFFLTHNGTLSEYKQFGKKYGYNYKHGETDTQVLAHVLCHQDDDEKILAEYEGDAALAFGWEGETAVWLWKGAHVIDGYKKTGHYKIYNNELVVERPLHIWKSDHGIYWSSERGPLDVVSDHDEKNIFTLVPNTLYKLDKGKVVKKIPVKRTYTEIEKKHTPSQNIHFLGVGTKSYNNYTPSNTPKVDNLAPMKTAPIYIASGEIYFNNGSYYYRNLPHNLKVHGPVWVNMNDRIIVNPTEEVKPKLVQLFFWHGKWLANEQIFNKVLKSGDIKPELTADMLHKQSLEICEEENVVIYGGDVVWKKDHLTAPFCHFALKIRGGKPMVAFRTSPVVHKHNVLNPKNKVLFTSEIIASNENKKEPLYTYVDKIQENWFNKFKESQ
jgi:hypothetical protein